jgi:DNA-binding IclR family transcriptional regulator
VPAPRPRSVELAIEVLSTLARMAPTVALSELAASLGWTVEALRPIVRSLAGSGMVESWPDPDKAGSTRVMLSTRALRRIGLTLAPKGDRWNPDRPPEGPIKIRQGRPRRTV